MNSTPVFFRKESNEHGEVRATRQDLGHGEYAYHIKVKVTVDPKGVFGDVDYLTNSRVDCNVAIDGLLEDLYRISRGERAWYACFGQGVLA